MKFAFDVDGVITASPLFFSVVIKALMEQGHTIYILTDFDENFRKQREQELKSYDIPYHELIITKDKEKFCKEHNIDFAIDDDAFEYFPLSKKTNLAIIDL